jgi:hypothetical protein
MGNSSDMEVNLLKYEKQDQQGKAKHKCDISK